MIRHVKDFGAILLFDKRYSEYQNSKSISSWLQEKIVRPGDLDTGLKRLQTFYDKMKKLDIVTKAIEEKKE